MRSGVRASWRLVWLLRASGWWREAPCAAVFDLSTPEHELLYLRLTEQVDTYGDDDLRRLRDYTRPLLQPPSEKTVELIGPQPRLVE
jgi:hypothetical protein